MEMASCILLTSKGMADLSFRCFVSCLSAAYPEMPIFGRESFSLHSQWSHELSVVSEKLLHLC